MAGPESRCLARQRTQNNCKRGTGGSAAREGRGARATVATLMAEDKARNLMAEDKARRMHEAELCRVSLLFCHRPKRFEAPIKVVGCQFTIVGPHSQHRRLILQEHLGRV